MVDFFHSSLWKFLKEICNSCYLGGIETFVIQTYVAFVIKFYLSDIFNHTHIL